MVNEKYRNFFEEIKKFQDKQKQQKQRGLNNYNMVNVVRKENAEVGMHSNVIYSLIDPNGLHYQDDLFLQIFIKEVLQIEDFGEILSVNAEEATSEYRRVDFTIKSSNYYIGIEMKIDAEDLENQISHYFDDLSQKALNDNGQKVIIYYLTKDGKEASTYSSNGIGYQKISFEKHILSWIEKCQYEVKNITNLNEAFENYKNIVKKVLNQYEGNVMSLKNELLKNEEYFELAKEIAKAYNEAYNEKVARLKQNYINLVLRIADEKNLNYIDHLPKWSAVDFITDFTVRFIANENDFLIQVFDKNEYGHDVNKDYKQKVLQELQQIDNNFKSAYSKVYGAMSLNYHNLEYSSLFVLVEKLIDLEVQR